MNRIRLFLVRHGQTDYNLKHLLQGSGINSSLNQTGQNEAQKLKNTGKLLMHTDKIYSSPLERAVQTGEIVTGLNRDRKGPLKPVATQSQLTHWKKFHWNGFWITQKLHNGWSIARAWIWYA